MQGFLSGFLSGFFWFHRGSSGFNVGCERERIKQNKRKKHQEAVKRKGAQKQRSRKQSRKEHVE